MSLGIDIGATKIQAALVKEGKILKTLVEPTEKNDLVSQIITMVKVLSPATSIGVGFAGQVKEGVILSSPNLSVRNYPLKSLLEDSLHVPVAVANDVQASALGEWRYGSGRGSTRLIVAQLGTGIGGAFIFEDKLLTGFAGEIGHMVIVENGLKCTCGRKGCLEAYAGGWAIAMQGGKETAREVFEQGNPEVIQQAFKALITGLANLVNLFNPDRILVGGGLLQGFNQVFPDFISQLETRVKKEALSAAQNFTLSQTQLSSVIGCAALYNSP